MPYSSYSDAAAGRAKRDELTRYVADAMAAFTHSKDVELDFLGRADIGHYCQVLGFKPSRNWAELQLDEISPLDETGTNVTPEDEANQVLAELRSLIEGGLLTPMTNGKPHKSVLADFLPKGHTFEGEKTLGHSREWAYAMAVELEHGRDRGMNVTNNHPLLTGMVVLSHLAEDRLYYARLWVMETEGDLFTTQLEKKPHAQVIDLMKRLSAARTHLDERMAELLEQA